ncbi:DUF4185 domain-containing protein [Segniliparus rugosus]|uniref:Uncharacterized protein n=1 Tax=Segniliparus rugosus (strain ATCC BAA-974 / DSM 45345 / CCUG 50838 / CIP 108380 / JCM 13579 / CDC 945) TaxID=679197 RepID=E5XRN9_SEGRC|nr:DUF4185 domain-containing protein [Segniliparus rugosus]EFV13002.2 hypothetical protein HMPREF9336_02161 [Segniliparus rugosus ATCC BAA-974]
MSPPPGVAVDPDRLAGMGVLVVDLSERYNATATFLRETFSAKGDYEGLLEQLARVLYAFGNSYIDRQTEHGKALRQTGDDCVEAAKEYHKQDSKSAQSFWDWLQKNFDHKDAPPHPDLSPMGFPPVDAAKFSGAAKPNTSTWQIVQYLLARLRPIDGAIEKLAGTALGGKTMHDLSGDWPDLVRVGNAYQAASDAEKTTADEYKNVVAGVDKYWQSVAAQFFGDLAERQLDQVDWQIGNGAAALLKHVGEQGDALAKQAAGLVGNGLSATVKGRSVEDWLRDFAAHGEFSDPSVKDAVTQAAQSIVSGVEPLRAQAEELVKNAHMSLRALEAELTGNAAWVASQFVPGMVHDPEQDIPPQVVGVEAGPDVVFPGPPTVKGADLGVPVPMGPDENGVEQYIFIMGDTADKLKPEGGGDGRVAGNAVLKGHIGPDGKMVYDGFMTNPDGKPTELFPVETCKPKRFTPPPNRSLVPTSAKMVDGKLVVAWQQINWDAHSGATKENPEGHEASEKSWIASYDVDPKTKGVNPVATSNVELQDKNFRQVQLSTYKDPQTGKEQVMIVGSAESRTNTGPHFAKVDPDGVSDPSKWQYYDPGAQNSPSHGWGQPGQVPSHPYTIPNFPNVGEASTQVVGNRIVMVYTDGDPDHGGVYMRSAPLDDPSAFGPPQPIVTNEHTGQDGRVGDHYSQETNYGGFIQDVSPDGKTMTVMMSRWDPYGLYPVTVHLA